MHFWNIIINARLHQSSMILCYAKLWQIAVFWVSTDLCLVLASSKASFSTPVHSLTCHGLQEAWYPQSYPAQGVARPQKGKIARFLFVFFVVVAHSWNRPFLFISSLLDSPSEPHRSIVRIYSCFNLASFGKTTLSLSFGIEAYSMSQVWISWSCLRGIATKPRRWVCMCTHVLL